jgi:uncharacterized protein
VTVTRARRNFYEEDHNGNTGLPFGLVSGYPCCTCNMHQGWPKLVQNLWYATPDGGLAALVYAPCELDWVAGDGVRVKITEDTNYPFEETVRFRIEPDRPVTFPLKLRVPEWAATLETQVTGNNDRGGSSTQENGLLVLKREWSKGAVVRVTFGTKVRTSRWVENSVAVERGPLVYALRIEEDWRFVKSADQWGDFYEVHPKNPWNYGLLESAVNSPEQGFEFSWNKEKKDYPWSLKGTPVQLRTRAKRIPEWQLYNHQAGPLPHSRPLLHLQKAAAEEIVLVPYGASRLRITEFPVVK